MNEKLAKIPYETRVHAFITNDKEEDDILYYYAFCTSAIKSVANNELVTLALYHH